MKYRYFQSSFEEIKKQFIKNYSKDLILHAKEQKEFEKCIRIMKLNPFDKIVKALVLDYFLLYDILTEEENISNLKEIEENVDYIVLCGPEKELKNIEKRITNF
jgi:hypothetical protein